jgi:hypothetical protein
MCAGAELDSGFAEMIASIQAESSLLLPTFSLALAALQDPHWSAISPGAPLRYWRLLEPTKSQLTTRSPLRIDEHILHYLTGINDLNEKLKDIVEPVLPGWIPGFVTRGNCKKDYVFVSDRDASSSLPVIQLWGNDLFDKKNNCCLCKYQSRAATIYNFSFRYPCQFPRSF